MQVFWGGQGKAPPARSVLEKPYDEPRTSFREQKHEADSTNVATPLTSGHYFCVHFLACGPALSTKHAPLVVSPVSSILPVSGAFKPPPARLVRV